MYKSKILNSFYEALFSTDFNDYSTATQDTKTDTISDFNNFEDWLSNLIDVFVDEFDADKTELLSEVSNSVDFRNDLKAEYEDLLELCD